MGERRSKLRSHGNSIDPPAEGFHEAAPHITTQIEDPIQDPTTSKQIPPLGVVEVAEDPLNAVEVDEDSLTVQEVAEEQTTVVEVPAFVAVAEEMETPAGTATVKPTWEGDDMVFGVKSSDAWRILKSHGQQFRNVIVSVQRADYRRSGNTEDGNTLQDLNIEGPKGDAFKAVLNDRYDAKNKLLQLDRLVDDARLQGTGTWDPSATSPKRTDFFGQLMRLCKDESVFASRAIKAELVQRISLANNGLTNVGPVVELASAFPDTDFEISLKLRALDLSNNRIADMRALEPFRGKFKQLEWLIISPNPVETNVATVLQWFPSVRTLDNAQVSVEPVTSTSTASNDLPFATAKDNFHDQGGIAESTIKELLLGTDSNRAGLVTKLYDEDSVFSLSFNSSAPRLATTQSAGWEPYVKQSRNLKKVTTLGPRIQRLAKGIAQIQEAFQLIPRTLHPNLVEEVSRYSFECTPIPGVPDPQNGSTCGVGGLKIDVHGSFDEIDNMTGIKNATRSFDRVFILGPGKGQQQLRIISDILILRAEGGHDAFNPQTTTLPDVPAGGAPCVSVPAVSNTKRIAVAGEVSKATGLTIEWATNLLSESGWDFQTALENFKAARVSFAPF
ncbi:MAG: hypothetical protein Q9168_002951 [Polycauliona sp. 1 TL-2023]